MNYEEIMMLEYIDYLSKRTYEYDHDFDGWVRLEPDKVKTNKGFTVQEQNKIIASLVNTGEIEWGKRDDGALYVRLLRHHGNQSAYQPHSEEERRWIVLAHHVPTYQHGKTVHDYVEDANRKYRY